MKLSTRSKGKLLWIPAFAVILGLNHQAKSRVKLEVLGNFRQKLSVLSTRQRTCKAHENRPAGNGPHSHCHSKNNSAARSKVSARGEPDELSNLLATVAKTVPWPRTPDRVRDNLAIPGSCSEKLCSPPASDDAGVFSNSAFGDSLFRSYVLT